MYQPHDRPFGCPADIILDLPLPLSVNATRRVNYAAMPRIKKWLSAADAYFLAAKRALPPAIPGRYEAIITINEKSRIDLDNGLKGLLDYCRNAELVEDDSPRFLRKITVGFGEAPSGSRVVLRPCQ